MKRTRTAPWLLLALAAGCSDGPTEPQAGARVEIRRGSIPFDEETIAVGGSLALSAAVVDPGGKPVPGQSVQWKSTEPGVATVTGGQVSGTAAGTALIVATSGSRADTARVNVALPVSGALACGAGTPRPSLSIGQAYEASAFETVDLCAEGGATGAEYLLVPFYGSRASGATVALELTAAGAAAPPVTSLAPAPPPGPTAGGPVPDRELHLRLRERALPGLTRRMRELHAGGAPSHSTAALVPAVGELLRFNVQSRAGDGCSDPQYRTGRVVALTSRAVVVADTLNPAGFSTAEYEQIGAAFDQLVYPLGTQTFGEPSDIDSNGRSILFYTSAVNDLTTAGSGYYFAGFFYDRDLFPRTGSGACAGSNQAEMFYLMVPDPERSANGEAAFSKDNVLRHTVAVVGHEFQHLINASRRLHVNKAPVWEETWLNEGLSHVAEEMLFYRASALQPRSNLDGSGFSSQAVDAFRTYQLQNVERLVRFLGSPQTSSPIAADDALATRAATWSLLRYLADRGGTDGTALWRELANSRSSGMDNLAAALGTDPMAATRDWMVSVYADDAGFPVDGRYSQASWNHRELLRRLTSVGGSRNYTSYPLRTHPLSSLQPVGLQLPAGGGAFVRFTVAPGQAAAVRTTSRGLPAPSTVRLVLMRTN